MLLGVHENFWYNLEHRTTRTSDLMAGESHVCQFQKRTYSENSNVKNHLSKKNIFETLMTLRFWSTNHSICIFETRYTYMKCF